MKTSINTSTSARGCDLSLPSIDVFVKYPGICPLILSENIVEHSRDESVFDYLDDLISVAEGMLAYAGAVRPVLERIAEAVRHEEEADA